MVETLVRSSSELAIQCYARIASPTQPRRTQSQPTVFQRRIGSGTTTTEPKDTDTTWPSEPILFPKLRIYFADFPYLHSSMD